LSKKIEKKSKFESLKGQDARKSVTVIVGLFCCTGSLSAATAIAKPTPLKLLARSLLSLSLSLSHQSQL
jgi:hypothetical protein